MQLLLPILAQAGELLVCLTLALSIQELQHTWPSGKLASYTSNLLIPAFPHGRLTPAQAPQNYPPLVKLVMYPDALPRLFTARPFFRQVH